MIVLELNSQDLSRIYKVDVAVCRYFKSSLMGFCERYNYDKFFIEIIKQVTEDPYYQEKGYFAVEMDDDLEDRYYEIEKKFTYGNDSRGIVERVISLGVNWVIEDILVHKSSGTFILTGCDNSRDLMSNPITNVPDIRYVGEGKSFYVEVCSDFNSFMKRFRRYDLRKIKFYKMSDMVFIDRQNIVLLFVDIVNKTYIRIPFTRILREIYKNNRQDLIDKYKYNTVCIEFDDEDDEFKSLDELFEKLSELSNGRVSDNNGTYKIDKEEQKEDKIEEEKHIDFDSCVVKVEEKEEIVLKEYEEIPDSSLILFGNVLEKKDMGIEDISEMEFPMDINPFTGELDDMMPF